MKKTIYFLTVVACSLFMQDSMAQCTIQNPGMDPNPNPPNNASTAFQDGDVPNWQAWSGSPSLFGSGSSFYAWVWSDWGASEIILSDFDFETDLTYNISFDVRTDDNSPTQNSNTVGANASANVYAIDQSIGAGTIPGTSTPNTQRVWTYSNANNSATWYSDLYASWSTIQVNNFQPTGNYDGLLFFPFMAANAPSPFQANMMIDNVVVTANFENEYHFQTSESTSGASVTTFDEDCDVFLNGLASQGEERFFVSVYSRPGQSGNFNWVKNCGWTSGDVGVFNLSDFVANHGVVFDGGNEYKIMLATQNLPCFGWEAVEHTFYVNAGADVQTGFELTNSIAVPKTFYYSDDCEDVYIDASASSNYNNYYIAARRRLVNTSAWSWVGAVNWTAGPIVGLLNLSNTGIFNSTGIDYGYEYEITFVVQNTTSQGSPCQGWMPLVKIFQVADCSIARFADDGNPNTIDEAVEC